MTTSQRNLFLALLVVIAVVGVGAIFLITRPKGADAGNATSTGAAAGARGAEHDVTFSVGGQSQTVKGYEVKGDPTAGARFTLGQANAPVKVVEFANYQCYYCGQFEENTQSAFLSRFVNSGVVHFFYRDFVIAEYPDAFKRAAAGAACAADQNKFWEMHDALYRVQTAWGPLTGGELDAQLTDYASQLGLDTSKFSSCLSSGQYANAVMADHNAGLGFGVNATPSFIINGVLFEGAQPIEFFAAAIQAAQNNWK
ncbi:MAG TPA: thioredoxin domain-containing protein [Deinococcales bacterium]|nr:thioredoxin domain-containing protein [Deinococcales bacterium]